MEEIERRGPHAVAAGIVAEKEEGLEGKGKTGPSTSPAQNRCGSQILRTAPG